MKLTTANPLPALPTPGLLTRSRFGMFARASDAEQQRVKQETTQCLEILEALFQRGYAHRFEIWAPQGLPTDYKAIQDAFETVFEISYKKSPVLTGVQLLNFLCTEAFDNKPAIPDSIAKLFEEVKLIERASQHRQAPQAPQYQLTDYGRTILFAYAQALNIRYS